MSMSSNPIRWGAALVPACIIAVSLPAQQARTVTAADYARAERGMQPDPAIAPLAAVGQTTPHWMTGDRFWFRNSAGQFFVVDPARKTRTAAFDQAKLAVALSTATGGHYDAQALSFTTMAWTADGKAVMVTVDSKEWSCDTRGTRCSALPAGSIPAEVDAGGFGRGGRGGRGGGGGGRGGAGTAAMSSDRKPLNLSPDGKRGAFVRDGNLWVRDIASGQEKQLTTDAVPDYGYATDNAGWTHSDRAVLLWSPDSRMIATQQQDQRGDGDMYLVSTPTGGSFSDRLAGHPVLRAWKYPLPGDSVVTMIHRVIVDAETGKMVRLQMAPDQHRSIQGDNLSMSDVKWAPDDSRIVFASVSRDHKHVWIREGTAATGAVRTVFEDSEATQLEGWAPWEVFFPTNEVLWYSQRDNHGHLYLYDLTTGKLKNQVTSGDGNVTRIARINDTTRTIWYVASGAAADQNPYFNHMYRVNFDGTHQVALTPDEGDHAVVTSPDGRFLVDNWTESNAPTSSALRDGLTGAVLMPLAQGDAAKLLAAGWHPPTVVKMKGRDGTTDIYGVMYTPHDLDSNRKYPIINHIYPGPQTGSVSGGFAYHAGGGETQGLADLGFVVVEINGMGTPGRDKKFMDAYFEHMGDNTLPDQVAGMKELAQRYKFIDIDQAGIYGHSGGGFATADAMFRYPDFFKVGIAESGNHDNREYEDDWGERYQGLMTHNADGSTNYDAEANENIAKNLKGHLLLAHGTMDDNVPPYNTLLIVDQLIKNNKDFDLLLIPNVPHGYGTPGSTYMQRRRWDYFVRYLMGAEPPKEFLLGQQQGRGGRGRGGQ
jgi:dipeptidyl-peptidase-4